jgi:hypothetical protein
VPERKKSKVMIFGDSHARGCAAELGNLLKKDFEVLGNEAHKGHFHGENKTVIEKRCSGDMRGIKRHSEK